MTALDGWGGQDGRPGGGPQGEEAEILADVREWELRPGAWGRVDELLVAMTTALAAADHETFADARDALERAAPHRIGTRIGDPAAGPVPKLVREHLDRLVHDLRDPHDRQPERSGEGDGVVAAD
ncbi:CATRA system-associated protein [Streptomyces iakyrus]|uniref:CATRA system-associated protein n=1 Tax=Streptomyces iakyrus TaxID=68219 RepID=UPI0036F10D9B